MKSLKFTLVELIVCILIICTIATTIIIAGAVIVGGCWLGSKAHKEGVKPTVERIWEGPKSDSEVESKIVEEK